MKKIIIIISVLIFAAVIVSYKSIIKQKDEDAEEHITEFNYKGHRYLLYKSSFLAYRIYI